MYQTAEKGSRAKSQRLGNESFRKDDEENREERCGERAQINNAGKIFLVRHLGSVSLKRELRTDPELRYLK
jgi:hypothetical protein